MSTREKNRQDSSHAKWFAGQRLGATLLTILLFTTLVHLTSFQEGHDWGGDFSSYIHQAKALVDGTVTQLRAMAFVRLENSAKGAMVGEPLFYPWGFPLLLSPIYSLFGLDLLPMKVLVLAFALAAQTMTFFLLRGRLPDGWVLLIAFIMGVNPEIFSFKNRILSDIPFLFFVLLSLFLMQRIVIDRGRFLAPARHYVLLGLAILCAFLTRTHGLALIPTLAVVQAVQIWDTEEAPSLRAAGRAIKRLRPVSIIPYVVLAVGAGLIRLTLFGADTSYVTSGHFVYGGLNDFVAVLSYNVAYYAWLPSKFLDLATFGKALNILVLMPLALFGAYRRIQRDYLILIFTAFYMAVLLVFPFHQGIRFILPVMPIYLYFAVSGAIEAHASLVQRLPLLIRMPNLATLIFLPLTVYLATNVAVRWTDLATHQSAVLEGPYTTTSLDIFEYVRNSTPESAVITFWKPRVLMLYTGRQGIGNFQPTKIVNGRSNFLLVYTGGPKVKPECYLPLLVFIRSLVTKVALCNRQTHVKPNPWLEAVTVYPDRFTLVYQNPDFLLYRILSEECGLEAETALEPTQCNHGQTVRPEGAEHE